MLRGGPDRPRVAAAQGPVLSPRAHGPARGGDPAHPPAHRDQPSSTRSSSTAPGPHVDNVVAGAVTRLAGGPGHPGLRARRGPAGPPAPLPQAARPARRRWPSENGTAADPVVRQRLARAHVRARIMRYNTLRSPAGHRRPGGPARGLDRQALLGHLAPAAWASWPWTSWAPTATVVDGRPLRARRRSSGSSSSPGPTPSTGAPTRSSATSSASGSSASRPSPRVPA